MNNIVIRKAQTDDLPIMQDIAKRTIDKCYVERQRVKSLSLTVNLFVKNKDCDPGNLHLRNRLNSYCS